MTLHGKIRFYIFSWYWYPGRPICITFDNKVLKVSPILKIEKIGVKNQSERFEFFFHME